jgi:hypothetical protein
MELAKPLLPETVTDCLNVVRRSEDESEREKKDIKQLSAIAPPGYELW